MEIDKKFISENEGEELEGYVPKDENEIPIDHSGVTIGTGVDLGQMNRQELLDLPISCDLKNKLSLYLDLQGKAADDALKNYPLSITFEEAASLSEPVMDKNFKDIADRYDKTKPPNTFEQLPGDIQTAIADLAYQYGPKLPKRTPKFWGYITKGDWNSAVKELNDFNDKFPTRRKKEAKLIQRALDNGWPDNYLPGNRPDEKGNTDKPEISQPRRKEECDVLLLDHRLIKDDEGRVQGRVRVEGNVLALKPRGIIYVRIAFYGKDGSEHTSLAMNRDKQYESGEIYHFICPCICVTATEAAEIVNYRIKDITSTGPMTGH